MWQDIKNIYHLGIAILANIFYGYPSRKLRVIGVTGTDGKTTTTSLIYHILNTSGCKTSMVSSVGATIGDKKSDLGFHITTPSPFAVQNFVKKAVEGGSKYLILETTSHALDQYRVFGINFEVGVLTNVTHEHLDYHKTYRNYVKTKAKLLKMARVVIVNRDDESYELISKLKSQNSKVQLKTQKFVTYGMKEDSDINPQNFPFKTSLIGEFNKYNILAAICTCKALGISDKDIRKGIESFVPPLGREDIVYNKDFRVMIDFAHTPNAFDAILSSIRPSIKSRLIHVFGAAGLRDASKRPLMGKASSKYADIIILTSEDPRSESVEKIMNEIEAGIFNFQFSIFNEKLKLNRDKKYLFKIADRKTAIETAIKMAKKGDFVIMTGKSHEKSMNYGHGEEPWDEYGAVREGLRIKD